MSVRCGKGLVLVALCMGAGACAPPVLDATRDARPRAIILVSMDTLRADRVGAIMGARAPGEPSPSPNLDRFAAEGITFTHAYSQAATTALSHGSLFTSRDPLELPREGHALALGGPLPTLAGVLAAYGWDTAAFVAGGELAPSFGLGEGFATWESTREDFASLWHTAPRALAWLDARADDPDPYLLFVHGYDAHTRYVKPGPWGHLAADPDYAGPMRGIGWDATDLVYDGAYHASAAPLEQAFAEVHPRAPVDPAAERLSDADLAHLGHLYDGAAAWGDTMFGLLLAELAARGVLEQAVVVVFADHGEQLGEAGVYNHCCGAGDPETHVPLLVRMPGGAGGGRRVDTVVELTDVLPTLLALSGATAPATVRGVDLSGVLRGGQAPEGRWAFSVAGPKERILSVRGAGGRLVWTGPPPRDAAARALLAVQPFPGPAFAITEAEPSTDAAWTDRAHAALLARVAAQDGGKVRAGEGLDPARTASMRAHGYWEAR